LTLLDKAEMATKQRPLGITFIAGVELALALAGVVVFGLTLAGTIPLAYGRYLVGPGMHSYYLPNRSSVNTDLELSGSLLHQNFST